MDLKGASERFGFDVNVKDINDEYIEMSIGEGEYDLTQLERVCLEYDCGPAIHELLQMRACVTYFCLEYCKGCYLEMLVEHCEESLLCTFMRNFIHATEADLGVCRLCVDYGASSPIQWATQPVSSFPKRLFEYENQVLQRVAACRRTLVALVAYCRRSAYAGLRPAYAQLAKWIWRMRGGGERCGPRGEKWEKSGKRE